MILAVRDDAYRCGVESRAGDSRNVVGVGPSPVTLIIQGASGRPGFAMGLVHSLPPCRLLHVALSASPASTPRTPSDLLEEPRPSFHPVNETNETNETSISWGGSGDVMRSWHAQVPKCHHSFKASLFVAPRTLSTVQLRLLPPAFATLTM